MGTSYRAIDRQDYLPFAGNKLMVGTKIPFDVYVKKGGLYDVLFESGTDFTAITKDFLVEHGLSELYVSGDDKPALNAYLSKSFPESPSILDNSKAFKDYSFRKDQYYQIDKQMLIPGTSVNFPVCSMKNYYYATVLAGSDEKPALIDDGLRNVRSDLLITKTDIPKYNDYLSALLAGDKIRGKDAGKIRTLLIKENSKIVIKDLLDNPRSGEKIKQTQDMVHGMIDSIMTDRDTIYDLLSIRGSDYYTYTHSVNVGVLAVGLGVAANLGRSEVERLGMGAMLHDIGKNAIPSDILNKQGKLDDAEFMIIQGHVAEGEKILRANHHIPEDALTAVTQHHEKLSGKGYPARLSGDRITLFGRITAIADCYDALTTARPYKPSFTPFFALNVIAKETDNYDGSLLKLFIRMLGKIGS